MKERKPSTTEQRPETNKNNRQGWQGKTVVVMMAATALLTVTGMIAANAVTNLPVIQHASTSTVQGAALANWPVTPSVTMSSKGSATSCAPAASMTEQTYTQYFALGINYSATNCATGDFAEVWSWTPALATTSETDTFTFYVQFVAGNGQTVVGSQSLTLTVAGTTVTTAGMVVIIVDYGQAAVPVSITTESVLVQ